MYEGFYPLFWFLLGFICGAVSSLIIVLKEDESE